jgi:hypothetical protein
LPRGRPRGLGFFPALDEYPVGPVDVVRLQRVVDVMRRFLAFPAFSVRSMVRES